MRLVVLGLGYSAQALVRQAGTTFSHVTGTMRDPSRAAKIVTPELDVLHFDGGLASDQLREAIGKADALLVSIPPDRDGDPVLRHLEGVIAGALPLRWIGYLSTVGVYGDHDGAWVDEATPCRPVSERSVMRARAEQAWLELGRASGKPVQVFRLSGIYGPGRNALVNLMDGSARRIDKPGQVFNRIHVGDIAGAVLCAMQASLGGGTKPEILNVTDDDPCPPQDVVVFAARQMGMEIPPLIPFADAALSPMGRSFYGENKRVSNRLIKSACGYAFRFPTYREGLASLWHEMQTPL
jgi:nucleoside-diphosphate-sugar epimerase